MIVQRQNIIEISKSQKNLNNIPGLHKILFKTGSWKSSDKTSAVGLDLVECQRESTMDSPHHFHTSFRPTTSRHCLNTLLTTLLLTVTLCATLTVGSPVSSGAFTKEELRKIDTFCGKMVDCAHIPGLSLGVVRGDDSFATGHGLADLDTGHAVDKRTMFTLGSTAKAFVPYVLAELMNGKENRAGRLLWDSTLGDLLRTNFGLDLPVPWANLTLLQTLIYKSGSSAADLATMAGLPREVTREELIKRMRFLPKSQEFKETNHYSNYMYTIAAHLAEKFSGMGWEDLVKARVLDKRDMYTTLFAPEGLSHADAALPYRKTAGMLESKGQNLTLFDLQPFEPIGSLMASADDITKWLRHLLHNLHFKGNDSGINLLIGDAFHTAVNVPENHKEGFLSHPSEVPLGYGMGWYTSYYRGLVRHSYKGGLYAYTSHIWLFPAARVAIYLATNGPDSKHAQKALEGILYYVTDLALRQKDEWVTADLVCKTKSDDSGDDSDDYYYEDESDLPPPMLFTSLQYQAAREKYVGKYGNGLVGDAVVEQDKSGALVLTLGRNLRGRLEPESSESRLRLKVSEMLQNTEEWHAEKIVEFRQVGENSGNGRAFDVMRLHLSDSLYYDFERDRSFESMLKDPVFVEVKGVDDVDEMQTSATTQITSQIVPFNGDSNVGSGEPQPGSNGYKVDQADNDPSNHVKSPDQTRRHAIDEGVTPDPDNGGASVRCSLLSLLVTTLYVWV